jgi:hypothetical protein
LSICLKLPKSGKNKGERIMNKSQRIRISEC